MPMFRIGCPVRLVIVSLFLLVFAVPAPAQQVVINPTVQGGAPPPRDRVPPPRTVLESSRDASSMVSPVPQCLARA